MRRWTNVRWDIRREGHPWTHEEFEARLEMLPEKMEVIDGKLFWDENERMMMLGAVLEGLGIDKAVRLGNPKLWREALAALEDQE